MVLILAAHCVTPISTTLLFWVAFVLTRPLGATVGDFFSEPSVKSGLNLGTVGTSATLATILLVLIGIYVCRATEANGKDKSCPVGRVAPSSGVPQTSGQAVYRGFHPRYTVVSSAPSETEPVRHSSAALAGGRWDRG
jgi:hypothetical protein